MGKNNIETDFRTYASAELSPSMEDIQFVSKIYESITDILGVQNCLQIGSFPRYTAIKPLHDLDVLYRMGPWDESKKNPAHLLEDLENIFRSKYKNPTNYSLKLIVQTHSLSIRFNNTLGEEVFAVDIVPAMNEGQNEFGDDTFYVPEILKYPSKARRQKFYEEIKIGGGTVDWIKSDPIGYITIASNLNKINSDFRKTVKFLKAWKNYCKTLNAEFKVKSFHLEQSITLEFIKNSGLTIFDAIHQVLSSFKQKILHANIPDRADRTKFIDSYVNELTQGQKDIINRAVDAIILNLNHYPGNALEVIESGFKLKEDTSRVTETEAEKNEREKSLRNISNLILEGNAFTNSFGIISDDKNGVKHQPHTNYGG